LPQTVQFQRCRFRVDQVLCVKQLILVRLGLLGQTGRNPSHAETAFFRNPEIRSQRN